MGHPITPYEYNCSVIEVVSGDILLLKIDLGFGVSTEVKIRLWGEKYGRPTFSAKEFIERWIEEASILRVRTAALGKHGPWLAFMERWVKDEWDSISLNKAILDQQFGRV